MSYKHIWRRSPHLSALFCLLILFSACGQLSGNRPSSSSTPAATATSPTLITSTARNPRPCPRSALVSHLPTSTHPTLVYVAQQGDSNALQRYDVTTGSHQTLLKTQPGETIQQANISPDGRWIVFRSLFQGQVAIQMIGVNGQQLQTLYCALPEDNIDDALLSPDQHTMVFNEENQDGISTLYLLDMATGKLSIELSPLQPNFPGIAQEQFQTTLMSERVPSSEHYQVESGLTILPFNPLPSKHYLIYIPMKWANNSSVYVYGTFRASGAPIHELALLLDTRKDVTQQGSNLQSIATSGQNFVCQDDDVTPDNTQLVCSAFIFTAKINSPNVIKMWPIAGGTQRVVYQGQPGERVVARALSNSTLLFLRTKANGLATFWRINTDGSGLAQLMAAQTRDMDLEFASSSYLSWSITSRDGKYYALTMYNVTSNASALIVGNLHGGQSKTIASSTNPLQLAGWA